MNPAPTKETDRATKKPPFGGFLFVLFIFDNITKITFQGCAYTV